MKNNILILSAGRRVELIQAFKRDVIELGLFSRVFATDMNPHLSPACQVADKAFVVPKVTEGNYIETLFHLCKKYNITLLVPTIDTELLLLSQYKQEFAKKSITVLISDSALIKNCRDKRRTATWFKELGIDSPNILDKLNLSFPCFCKPYDGSCSKGAIKLNDIADLTEELLGDPKNMFMELVPKSYSEYTIDAYYNKSSDLKCLVPRKRLEVRAGEVSKGLTKKNFVYDYLLERVKKLSGAVGCITFQLFVNEDTESIKGLEVNPRFGGGFPLADAAGATFTKWLLEEYFLNKPIEFNDSWRKNTLMLRYDAKVIINDYLS